MLFAFFNNTNLDTYFIGVCVVKPAVSLNNEPVLEFHCLVKETSSQLVKSRQVHSQPHRFLYFRNVTLSLKFCDRGDQN